MTNGDISRQERIANNASPNATSIVEATIKNVHHVLPLFSPLCSVCVLVSIRKAQP